MWPAKGGKGGRGGGWYTPSPSGNWFTCCHSYQNGPQMALISLQHMLLIQNLAQVCVIVRACVRAQCPSSKGGGQFSKCRKHVRLHWEVQKKWASAELPANSRNQLRGCVSHLEICSRWIPGSFSSPDLLESLLLSILISLLSRTNSRLYVTLSSASMLHGS